MITTKTNLWEKVIKMEVKVGQLHLSTGRKNPIHISV